MASDELNQERGRRKLRQLWRLLCRLPGIDIDEAHRTVARLIARQDEMTAAQRDLEGELHTLRAELAGLAASQAARPAIEAALGELALFNIKTLGYEIGRRLAERELARPVAGPGNASLQSKLCTQEDFTTDWMAFWCRELRVSPLIVHRKIWELCFIPQALFAAGMLVPGRRGLGFGCGEEPLPSLFAKYGARILATDLDRSRPETEAWRLTNEHSAGVESVRRLDICPDAALLGNIDFTPVDMNAIPREFDGQFDFCWSTCAFEHLGSIACGLAFVEHAMRTLRPGGIAVHTTEFTIDDRETIDHNPTVLYQRRHFIELAERLSRAGHRVVDFDFGTGGHVLDRFVDLPPFAHPALVDSTHYAHLKLAIDGYVCTSFGLIVRCGEAA